MATANFRTMRHFPLYAHENIREGYCPACDCWYPLGDTAEPDTCPECGAALDVSGGGHCAFNDFFWDDVQAALDDALPDLEFYDCSIAAGYYFGFQLLATVKPGGIESVGGLTNDDCHDFHGCCRSELARIIAREQSRIRRAFKQIARDFNFVELTVAGRFSDGSCVYAKKPVAAARRSRASAGAA